MNARRSLKVLPVAAAAATLTRPAVDLARELRRSMGVRPRRVASPQFRDGVFHNRLPSGVLEPGNQRSMVVDMVRKGDRGRPLGEIPLAIPDLPAEAASLAATWLGHTTVLVEIAGHWVLLDPVWSDRVSPSSAVGPKRSHPVPLGLEELPEITAVLISHDHYDHLDMATIEWLAQHRSTVFVVPLGIGAHLEHWQVPAERIVELDWDESHGIDDLVITCTEARHFSGRGLTTRNTTLWSSWSIRGGVGEGQRRVFFGGDTGYTPAFAELGERLGPHDLTILPIGAYDPRWSDIHMNPAEAIQTHLDVRGGTLLPVHWATFDLAFHYWEDPIEWLVKDAEILGVDVALPRPGQRFDIDGEHPRVRWWEPFARNR